MRLLDAVKQVESAGDHAALRFEPGLFRSVPGWVSGQVDAIQQAQGYCSHATAIMIACTSWGAWQMLGANVYANGVTTPIIAFAGDPAAQETAARAMITGLDFDPDADLESMRGPDLLRFASRWNGPGNPLAYLKALQHAAAS